MSQYDTAFKQSVVGAYAEGREGARALAAASRMRRAGNDSLLHLPISSNYESTNK